MRCQTLPELADATGHRPPDLQQVQVRLLDTAGEELDDTKRLPTTIAEKAPLAAIVAEAILRAFAVNDLEEKVEALEAVLNRS